MSQPPDRSYDKSEYDKRIISCALSELEGLRFLLEKAPEHLQARIFTADNMKRFLRLLFRVRETVEEMSEEERTRILKSCNCALDEIRDYRNGPVLAPNAWKVPKETASSSYHEAVYRSKAILALQIEGGVLIQEENEEKRKEGVKP